MRIGTSTKVSGQIHSLEAKIQALHGQTLCQFEDVKRDVTMHLRMLFLKISELGNFAYRFSGAPRLSNRFSNRLGFLTRTTRKLNKFSSKFSSRNLSHRGRNFSVGSHFTKSSPNNRKIVVEKSSSIRVVEACAEINVNHRDKRCNLAKRMSSELQDTKMQSNKCTDRPTESAFCQSPIEVEHSHCTNLVEISSNFKSIQQSLGCSECFIGPTEGSHPGEANGQCMEQRNISRGGVQIGTSTAIPCNSMDSMASRGGVQIGTSTAIPCNSMDSMACGDEEYKLDSSSISNTIRSNHFPEASGRPCTMDEIVEISPFDLKKLTATTPSASAIEEHRGCCPRRLRRAELRIHRSLKHFFGITDPDLVNGLPGSRAIDPASPFIGLTEAISAALLVYSLAVVPLQVSFWQSGDPCARSATLEFDMFADIFFLLDILINFLTGVVADGRYSDDPAVIARAYLTSPSRFAFDAATSFPFAWIDWWMLRGCPRGPAAADGEWADHLYVARAMKPLKILKMGRVLRIFRHVRAALQRLGFTPAQERVVQLILALLAFTHVFACCFWKVKVDLHPEDEVRAFLEARAVDPASVADVYVLCMYFVCTVLTTTGFGDVAAADFPERVFIMVLMACASLLFGIVLGEMQEIFAVSNAQSREREERLESVGAFLAENDVPPAVARRVRDWIRLQYLGQRADRLSRDVMATLPAEVSEELAGAINAGLLAKIPLFSRIPADPTVDDNLKARFTAALLPSMASAFHMQGAVVARHTDPADSVVVICAGAVGLHLPGRATPLLILRARDSFGDNALLGDPRWAGVFGVDADIVAREDCKVVRVRVEAVLKVAHDPSFARIRRLLDHFAFIPRDEAEEEEEEEERWEAAQGSQAVMGVVRGGADVRRARAVCWWIRMARARLRCAPASIDVWAHSAARLWSHSKRTSCTSDLGAPQPGLQG